MKKLLSLSIFLLFSFNSFSQINPMWIRPDNGFPFQKDSSRKAFIKKGKIKSEVAFMYKPKKGDEGKSVARIETFFDENGNVIEYSSYNSSGTKIGSNYYKFDENNRNIEYVRSNKNGLIKEKQTVTYNQQGKALEIAKYQRGGEIIREKIVNTFNEKGKPTESITYRKGEKIKDRIIYNYNEQGKLLERIDFNGSGKIYSRTLNEYSPEGELKSTSSYRKNKLQHKWVYDCTPKGEFVAKPKNDSSRVCKRTSFDEKGNKVTIEEERGEDGKIARKTTITNKANYPLEISSFDFNGKINYQFLFEYGPKNELVSEVWTGFKGKHSMKSTYNYDENLVLKATTRYNKKNEPSVVFKYTYNPANN